MQRGMNPQHHHQFQPKDYLHLSVEQMRQIPYEFMSASSVIQTYSAPQNQGMQIEKAPVATDFVKIQDAGDLCMNSMEHSAEE